MAEEKKDEKLSWQEMGVVCFSEGSVIGMYAWNPGDGDKTGDFSDGINNDNLLIWSSGFTATMNEFLKAYKIKKEDDAIAGIYWFVHVAALMAVARDEATPATLAITAVAANGVAAGYYSSSVRMEMAIEDNKQPDRKIKNKIKLLKTLAYRYRMVAIAAKTASKFTKEAAQAALDPLGPNPYDAWKTKSGDFWLA
jgi:hypothetical protein